MRGASNRRTAQDLLRHANPRILMQHYQQTVTEERCSAQELAFGNLMGTGGGFSGQSSKRTRENPRRAQKEEVKPLIN